MPRRVQNRVLDLVEQSLDTTLEREVCPDWLRRPGAVECGDLWETVQAIYAELTGMALPELMPARERWSIDAVLQRGDEAPRIVEVDEAQHFSPPRAQTLKLYPGDTSTSFDTTLWARRSAAVTKLRGGGWGRACPPLFPDEGGRHLQRAFRDGLADLLPSRHGWGPTVRIGDFEVLAWLDDADAVERMSELLEHKGLVL
jgi:hypothetical protein